jgi:hypothetical protein
VVAEPRRPGHADGPALSGPGETTMNEPLPDEAAAEAFGCGKCGADVGANDSVCPKCGVRFESAQRSEAESRARRNWKLVLPPSLVVCAFFNLVWVAIYGGMFLFGERAGDSAAIAIVPGLSLLCGFVVPSLMIAARTRTGRFQYGVLVGCVGWTLGLVVSIPMSVLMAELYYRGNTPTQTGQGEGILAALIWMAGLITSPGMGGLAAVAGGIRDRRRARLGDTSAGPADSG